MNYCGLLVRQILGRVFPVRQAKNVGVGTLCFQITTFRTKIHVIDKSDLKPNITLSDKNIARPTNSPVKMSWKRPFNGKVWFRRFLFFVLYVFWDVESEWGFQTKFRDETLKKWKKKLKKSHFSRFFQCNLKNFNF